MTEEILRGLIVLIAAGAAVSFAAISYMNYRAIKAMKDRGRE